ncbi:phage tail tube protein [Isoptericola aurantiacus]|uniref:phage tail tube protein n=1 Tax=Isoptericola aurantiacus TaxID=3377839 RepID=UPI00383A28CD
MAATPIPTSERFFAPEISKVFFATTLADYTAYTDTEVTAAQDLTGEIADLSGFMVSSGMIDTPDLDSRFTKQIGGRTSVDASSITFYADLAGDDVRTVLPRGTKGYLIFCDGGYVPTQMSDVYPVEVTSVGKVRSVGDQAMQVTIGFAISDEPAEDVEIPAAA